jgi:polysaccharide biosynthesis transport protein
VATLHLDPHPPRSLDETHEDYINFKANQATAVKGDPVLEATLAKPEAVEVPEVRAQGKDALTWMKSAVLVDDKTGGPEALRLNVTGDRGEDVAALANLWAQASSEVYTAREEARVKERLKQLRQNYRDNTELLRKKKNELQARRDLLGLEDPKVIDAKLAAEQTSQTVLQNQRVQVELDLKKLGVRSTALRAGVAAPDKIEVSAGAVDEELDKDFPQNPLVKAQIDQLLLLQKKLGDRVSALPREDRENDTGAVQYREAISLLEKTLAGERDQLHPDYEKRLRSRLVDRMKDDAAKAEQDIQGLKGQQETLEIKIKEGEGRIATLRVGGQAAGKSNPEVEAMQAEANEMETGVKRLSEEQANLEASLPLSPRLTVMEAAAVPRTPNMDKSVKAAGGAFLGLFGLVFLGVAVVEFRSRRVYKSDDVSQGLGLSLLGTVPTLPARARASAPDAEDAALGPMIESVDGIRTMLLHAGRSETLRVVMVASAVSGEGKTSLASHLAASLARGGRRTLLVDGDLRNPAAHQLFGLTAGPGFSELLRGEMEPSQVVQNTPLENLSLLAAGAADRRALQALAQEGILRNVFAELKENYDFLIVDVSPVLPVADALLIGEHADAVVMSVLRNVSRLPAVHAAQQRLASLGIRVLGAVVIGEGLEMYGNVRYPSVPATATK